MLEQSGVPLPRGSGFLIELVQRPPGPQTALDVEAGAMMIDGDGVGGISLQLHGIGASVFRRVDQGEGAVDIPVMVAGHLGDDIGRMLLSDQPSRYGYRLHSVIPCNNRAI